MTSDEPEVTDDADAPDADACEAFDEEGEEELDYDPELVEDLSPYDAIDGFTYDADQAPDPEHWLRFSHEAQRLLVAAYHRRSGAEFQDELERVQHGMLHVAIESQLAVGEMPVAEETVARFLEAGATRHAAIHAIASEFLKILGPLLDDPESVSMDAYEASLRAIEASSDWT